MGANTTSPPTETPTTSEPPKEPLTVPEMIGAGLLLSTAPFLICLGYDVLYFIGAAVRLGIRAGASSNWARFVSQMITAAWFSALMVAFTLVGALVRSVGGKMAPTPKKVIETIVGAIFAAAIGGLMLWVLLMVSVYEGYSTAEKDYASVNEPEKALAEGEKTLAKQRETLSQLTDSARDLLTGLDKTERELAEAKEQITDTLTKLSKQESSVNQAGNDFQELVKQQHDLQFQHTQIESALNGRHFLTREDAEKSTLKQYIVGGIIGVVGSLLAALIYDIFKRRRRPNAPSAT
jgi:uncharacterized membrane protein YgaE (UPF0421/DUF939 family)